MQPSEAVPPSNDKSSSSPSIERADQLLKGIEGRDGCSFPLVSATTCDEDAPETPALWCDRCVSLALASLVRSLREELRTNYESYCITVDALIERREAAEAAKAAAEQERDKWLDLFNRSEQFQNGPTKRAEAAESREQRLREALVAFQVAHQPEYGACSDGQPCWCGYNVGMGPTHSPECLQARAALSASGAGVTPSSGEDEGLSGEQR